ncbi:MAG: T9SS type A sorting domain-containing protein, partial [candidate division WOR-3 bacterium]
CTITPVSDNEFESCNYKIYVGKGFIKITSIKQIHVSIYSVNGNKVKDISLKDGKVDLKSGIYILKIGSEKLKVVVK